MSILDVDQINKLGFDYVEKLVERDVVKSENSQELLASIKAKGLNFFLRSIIPSLEHLESRREWTLVYLK
jgi:hypothetical protein